MRNADCIVIQGSNMAECHPVGFQWVMEAKARGATVIHVDPRFTRTSALADLHVPLRAGSDIAFLGGIINYVLTQEKYFREYVVAYTNAAVILTEDFAGPEDLDGVFSGLDREKRHYDFHTWQYEGVEVQAASGERDQEDEDRAGTRQAGRGEAHGSGGAGLAPGEPERDETLQHPRCVFQVLKRHFARYTPEMVGQVCGVPPDTFGKVCELVTDNSGPERTTAFVYSVGWTQHTVGVQYIRTASILQLLLGNIGRPGGGILALRGHASIQGSTDIPTLFNLLPGYLPMPHAHSTEDLGTEVFFLPAAAHTEKDGSFTNTQRMLQFHHQAVEPPGDARSDLWFTYHLGRKIREKLSAPRVREEETSDILRHLGHTQEEMDQPMLDLTWDYPVKGAIAEADAEAVLAEINGWDARGRPLASYEQLNDDGSTACGCWIYCGVYADGVNQAARRKPSGEQDWVAKEWGWAWPANRRILYNRASADPEGKPWSERKALVWWDEDQALWTGHDIADFTADKSPRYRPPDDATGAEALSGADAFVMQADGKAWLLVPD